MVMETRMGGGNLAGRVQETRPNDRPDTVPEGRRSRGWTSGLELEPLAGRVRETGGRGADLRRSTKSPAPTSARVTPPLGHRHGGIAMEIVRTRPRT